MVGEGIELLVQSRNPDEMSAYERLIGDALRGDSNLFAREDGVEAAWRVVDPVLGDQTPVYEYDKGTWGPGEATYVLNGSARWHDPRASTPAR
jgi:glucose-6-phosphate 1-dehydrogenase